MKHRAVLEKSIGETRAAVYEGRRLVELHVERDSQKSVPQSGDIYLARIANLEPSLNGAFVNLGGSHSGFLSFTNNQAMPKVTEGELLEVLVIRPPISGKEATLRYLKPAESGKPGPVEKVDLKTRLSARFKGITFDEATVSVLDEATDRRIALKGGGAVTFDQTQALLAIDVDKGQGKTALDVALAAAELIAKQIRLRGLGGLVVIDFPNLRQTRQRNQLFKAVERAFEGDPAIVKVAPLSRFGCVELTRSLDYPSLDSILNTRFGEPTAETQSLRALRQLVKEASENKGAQYTLAVSAKINGWLQSKVINWESELNDRIGPRFTLTTHEAEGCTIQADR